MVTFLAKRLAMMLVTLVAASFLVFAVCEFTPGSVARFDIAYALNRGPGTGSRWVVSIKGGQAFSLFNSAARGVDPSPPSRLN